MGRGGLALLSRTSLINPYQLSIIHPGFLAGCFTAWLAGNEDNTCGKWWGLSLGGLSC